MKFKSTWIAIAVFAALGAYLYFVDEPREKARQEAREKEGLLFAGFEPEQVTEVWLEGKTRGRIHLKRGEGGGWSLVEPVQDRADAGRVRNLLDDLKGLKAQREVAGADADLAPFGLSEPEVVVRTAGAAAVLAVGSGNPAGDARYVRAEGGAVKLAAGAGLGSFLTDAGELRSKDLLDGFPWARLGSVSIRQPSGDTVRLSKSGEAWAIEAPFAAEADGEAVDRMLEKIRWARVESFLDEDPAEVEATLGRGLRVELAAEGEGAPLTLRVAETDDGSVWAARSARDARFTLPKDVLAAVQVSAEALRRKKPVLVKSWRLKAFELEVSGKKLAYDKVEGSWRRADGAVEGEEAAALNDYLRAVESSQAEEVLPAPADPKDVGLEAPWLTARFTDNEGGEQVLRAARRDGAILARGGDAGPVYRMPVEYGEKAEALIRASEPKPAEPGPETTAKPVGGEPEPGK